MPSRLAASEIAQIRTALLSSAKKHGPDIIGAELGQLVKRAVAPKTIQSLGGLKSLAGNELFGIVEYVESLDSDTLYRVRALDESSLPTAASLEAELDHGIWEGFSNPNIDCFVGFDTNLSRIFVGAVSGSYGPEVRHLKKMASDEYHTLAQEYAAEQDNQELKADLLEVLQLPVFYAKWIGALQRHRRITSVNYLRTWEIKRTKLVMARLQQELESAGLARDRANSLANDVCSRISRNSYKVSPSSTQGLRTPGPSSPITSEPAPCDLRSPERQVKPSAGYAVTSFPASKDLQGFRELIHRAIDQMSLDDLKEIRVPAGLLFEAFQKSAD